MHYEIWDSEGNVIDTANDWSELMQKYSVRRKETNKPIHLEKIEEGEEK